MNTNIEPVTIFERSFNFLYLVKFWIIVEDQRPDAIDYHGRFMTQLNIKFFTWEFKMITRSRVCPFIKNNGIEYV